MKRGTQTRLAKASGSSDGHICDILQGRRRPGWDLAKKLAALTGTEPSLWMDSPPEVLREAASKFKVLSPAPAGK
jgi:transcriptional regulator with XRE-family HTH domain